MAEMIFLAYIIGYVQVYLLWNFDEADTIGRKEVLGISICTAIYAGVKYYGLSGVVLGPLSCLLIRELYGRMKGIKQKQN